MKTKFLSLLLGFSLIGFFSIAQTTKMNESPTKKEVPEEGPNLKKFQHPTIGFGTILGSSTDFRSGVSNYLMIGERNKRKINEWYSLGFGSHFWVYNFHVAEDAQILTPQVNPMEKQVFRQNALGLEFFNRFNFGKRGNRIGNFLELSVYGQWNMNTKLISKSEKDGSNRLVMRNINPGWAQRWNYGVSARLGFNRMVLLAQYRLSELFVNDVVFNAAPNLSIGLEIGLHK